MPERRTFSSSIFLVDDAAVTVLLVLHKRFDLWLPLGGEREGDETPLETAIREAREEIGITLTEDNFPECEMPFSPPGLIGYEEHDAGSKGLHMNFCFWALVSADFPPVPCDEHTQWAWFPLLDDAPAVTTPNVRYCLSWIRRSLQLVRRVRKAHARVRE